MIAEWRKKLTDDELKHIRQDILDPDDKMNLKTVKLALYCHLDMQNNGGYHCDGCQSIANKLGV